MSLRPDDTPPDDTPSYLLPADHPIRVARRAELDAAARVTIKKTALLIAVSALIGWLLGLLII